MENIVINCKTKKENDELLKTLDEKKYKRTAGGEKPSSINIYDTYRDKTCYVISNKELNFCSIEFAENQGFKIISLKEYITGKPDKKKKKLLGDLFSYYCPDCKAKIEKNQKTCHKCNVKLIRNNEKQLNETSLKSYFCPNCNEKIEKYQDKCQKCNTELVRNKKSKTLDNLDNRKIGNNKNKDTEKNTYKCQYCKGEIDNDALKCKFCGERVRKKKSKKERLGLGIIMIILYTISLLGYKGPVGTGNLNRFGADIIDILSGGFHEFFGIPFLMTIFYIIGIWFCKNKRVKIIFSVIFFGSIIISGLAYKGQEIQQENINNAKMWNNFMETNPEVFNK